MLYLILAEDRPSAGAARAAHRLAHMDYWAFFGPRVKLAGPWLAEDAPDGAPLGSMLIIEAPSLSEAESMIRNDPFIDVGVFSENIRVTPVRFSLGQWNPE